MKFKVIKYIILLALIISLFYFIKQVSFTEIVHNVKTIGWSYLWVFASTGLAYGLGTLSWKYCLQNKDISLYKLFLVRLIGENVSAFNPSNFIGGDSLKVYLLCNTKVESHDAISSILLSRITTILSQVVLFIAIGFLFISQAIQDQSLLVYILLATFGTISILLILVAGIFFHSNTLRFLLKKVKNQSIRMQVLKTLSLLKLHWRNNKWALFLSFASALLHWITGAIELFLLFHFLGTSIGFSEAILMDLGIVILKALVAFIPGQIGIEEYSNKVMMNIIGIHSSILWLSISLLRRFRQLIWIAISILAYYITEKKVGLTYIKPFNYGNIIH